MPAKPSEYGLPSELLLPGMAAKNPGNGGAEKFVS
jgi:hypothetical protein